MSALKTGHRKSIWLDRPRTFDELKTPKILALILPVARKSQILCKNGRHKRTDPILTLQKLKNGLFYDAGHYWPVVQQVKHLFIEFKNTLLICSIATPYASKESDVTQRNIAKLFATYQEMHPCADTLWVGLHIAASWKQGGWDPVFIPSSLMETEIPLQSFHQNYWGELI